MPNRLPFPNEEGELHTYFDVCMEYLIDNQVRLGVSDEDMLALLDEHAIWKKVFPAAANAATSTKSLVTNKNDSLKKMLAIMRRIYADIPKSKLLITDYDTFGMTQRTSNQSKNPRPKTAPHIHIESGNRLVHLITFIDAEGEGTTAKPEGIKSGQLWMRIGSEPTVAADLTFVGNCTKWPYHVEFKGADAGKMAYYWARWENTTAQVGEWGPVASATIGG